MPVVQEWRFRLYTGLVHGYFDADKDKKDEGKRPAQKAPDPRWG